MSNKLFVLQEYYPHPTNKSRVVSWDCTDVDRQHKTCISHISANATLPCRRDVAQVRWHRLQWLYLRPCGGRRWRYAACAGSRTHLETLIAASTEGHRDDWRTSNMSVARAHAVRALAPAHECKLCHNFLINTIRQYYSLKQWKFYVLYVILYKLISNKMETKTAEVRVFLIIY